MFDAGIAGQAISYVGGSDSDEGTRREPDPKGRSMRLWMKCNSWLSNSSWSWNNCRMFMSPMGTPGLSISSTSTGAVVAGLSFLMA